MTNKGLLVIIAVILLGILGVVALEYTDDSPAEKFADSVGDVTRDVGDGIEDAADEMQ